MDARTASVFSGLMIKPSAFSMKSSASEVIWLPPLFLSGVKITNSMSIEYFSLSLSTAA